MVDWVELPVRGQAQPGRVMHATDAAAHGTVRFNSGHRWRVRGHEPVAGLRDGGFVGRAQHQAGHGGPRQNRQTEKQQRHRPLGKQRHGADVIDVADRSVGDGMPAIGNPGVGRRMQPGMQPRTARSHRQQQHAQRRHQGSGADQRVFRTAGHGGKREAVGMPVKRESYLWVKENPEIVEKLEPRMNKLAAEVTEPCNW